MIAPKSGLSRKILGLALLNLILIAIVLLIFAQWQFGLSLESLLLGPARDRIVAIANAIGRDLDSTPYSLRTELLSTYAKRYDVDFYLVDPRGNSLEGVEVELPAVLLERLRSGGRLEGKGRHRDDQRAEKGKGPDERGPEGEPGFRRPGPGPGGPGFGQRGGPPSDQAFLTVARNPLVYWVGVRIPTNGPQGERGVPAVLLLRSNSIFNSKLFFDWRSLLSLAATLAAVALLCWWPFVHRVTRSIRQMDRATEEIAQGHFGSHVTLHRRDELGHLGEQINRMAGHLEGFVKHQKIGRASCRERV